MSITGLILAGGRGSRMGHIDKGLQSFRGAPLALQVLQRLAPQVENVMINANQNIAAYQAFDMPVWPDQLSGFSGPLAGVQTGLMHCQTPYLVTVPCDSPFIPEDLVERLLQALQMEKAGLAVAVTGAGNAQQSQFVFSLLQTSLLPHLTEYLQNGGRKVADWHASLQVAQVYFADESAFRNINTLEDLKKFEHD